MHYYFSSLVLVLTSCIALTSCSKTINNDLEEYKNRLSRVLAIEITAPPHIQPTSVTKTPHLLPNTDAININMTRFYSLQQCKAGTIVAQRNTTVGKVSDVSQRYIYEVKIIDALRSCLETLDQQESALKQDITQWLALKEQQLSPAWATLLLNSGEIRRALTPAPSLLMSLDSGQYNSGVEHWRYINKLDSSPTSNIDNLENHLQSIEQQRLPAMLWQTQDWFATALPPITNALNKALPQIACPNGQASESATILRNVFYLFFIDKLQPIASNVNQLHYQLAPIFDYWQQHNDLPTAFKRKITQLNNQGFSRYQRAVEDHLSLWQQFFARCNLSPQAPN